MQDIITIASPHGPSAETHDVVLDLLDEIRNVTGASASTLARRDGRWYRLLRVRMSPEIFSPGDRIELVNPWITNVADKPPLGYATVQTDFLSFSPLASLVVIPFTDTPSTSVIIFGSQPITTALPTLRALVRAIEVLLALTRHYERVTDTLEARLDMLDAQASRDPLTRVLNRRGFLEAITNEAKRIARNPEPVSLIMFDLDDLKYTNDHYGHLAGDEHLVQFARLLEASLRGMDVIGRLGGDEFAVLAPQTDARQVQDLAGRLRVVLDSHSLAVSMGLATLRSGDRDLDSLLPRADKAMYLNKARRKAQSGIRLAL